MKKYLLASLATIFAILLLRNPIASLIEARTRVKSAEISGKDTAMASLIPIEEDSFWLHDNVEIFNKIDSPLLYLSQMAMDSTGPAQKISWDNLKDVKFTPKYVKEYGQNIDFPVFGKKVKALDGKKVVLSGYIIPLDSGGFYALSRNPFKSCFFCGGAGPESIVGIIFAAPPKRYKTDDYLSFEGIFRLNDNDLEKLMYQLYAAKEIK